MSEAKIEQAADVARLSKQQSQRAFSTSRAQHQDKLERLEQLLQYKEDYEAELGVRARAGMDASQLCDYRAFLARLNAAIEQQRGELSQARENLDATQSHWMAKAQRSQALDQLVDERQRERSRARDKAEQKRADEDTLARNAQRPDS